MGARTIYWEGHFRGRSSASEALHDAVYRSLKRLAERTLRDGPERAGPGLEVDDLIHEAFVKTFAVQVRNECRLQLADGEGMPRLRTHRDFENYVAATMRTVLIDFRRKHGKGLIERGFDLTLFEAAREIEQSVGDLESLDRAISELQIDYPNVEEVVHLRVFNGHSCAFIAQCIGVSERTVRRILERVHDRLSGKPGDA